MGEKYPEVLHNVAAHPFKQFIFGKGRQDTGLAPNTQATLALMEEFHIPHEYHEMEGGHSFVFSRRFIASILSGMFR